MTSTTSAAHADTRQQNQPAIKQHLMGKGFPEALCRFISFNELCYWKEHEVDQVFARVQATPDEIRNPELQSFSVKPSAAEQAAGLGPTDFIKPSWEQVADSAAVLGALCVNRKGEFRTNPPGEYAALSHVWSQGLGSDIRNRGLHRSLIEQVFDLVEPHGIKWIWTDSLAIPGGGRELQFAEEEMKAMLINAMADIYRKASKVIVLDALTLRLDSNDAVSVAVILCFGKWLSRVWTYQEIKLATDAVIVTKAGFVRFADIVNTLRAKAHNEVGDGYKAGCTGQYPSLFRTFFRLQRNDNLGVSLPDIAIGCAYRDAFDKLDYARSVFPTLGLEWRFGDKMDDAMKKIYESQKRHATRLVLFHGPPRALYPGWAPAVFPGMTDSKIIEPGVWKLRGMAREWLASKINKIVPSKPGCMILELDNGQSPGAYSLCYISDTTKRQSPKSIDIFKEAVQKGTAYVLTDDPLVPVQHSARVGLVVEKFTKPVDSLEGWVCFTLAIGETEDSYTAERQEWLLLHENPAKDKGKEESELNYLLERSSQAAPSGTTSEQPLHAAAQSGDSDAIASMLSSPGYNVVDGQDSRGWTALHYAAAGGYAIASRLLATHSPSSLAIGTVNGETPLVLAAENGHQDAVCELVEAGADVNYFAPNGPTPLVVAARRGDMEMVLLLLAFGANPSLADGFIGATPLMAAIPAQRLESQQDKILAELIDAGADVSAIAQTGLCAIDFAVFQGNLGCASMLLAHGADPNGNPKLPPPLQHAIDERDAEIVQTLLEYGAQVSGPGAGRFRDGWTPMLWAAAVDDVPIGRLLYKANPGLLYAVGGKEKWTALHVSAVKGNHFFFKWVLEESKTSGHKWDEVDFQGKTAWELRSWEVKVK